MKLDDTQASWPNAEELYQSLLRYSEALSVFGFDLKHVYTNGDWIKGLQNTGKSFWNPDGDAQITFGFLYDCQKDLLTVNSKTQINVTKKVTMYWLFISKY